LVLSIAVLISMLPTRVSLAQPTPPAPERAPRQIVDEAWLEAQAEWAVDQGADHDTPDLSAALAIRLAYQSFRDGNWEIYTNAEDGSGLVRLTADPAPDVEPSLSPDASQVVFASRRTGNYELFVVSVDGTGLRQLTNHPGVDGSPAWSPDGRQIAFASDRDGNAEVYVINLDGSGLTRLTNAPGYDGEPDWSTDGRRLAFVSRRSGGAGDYFVWVMNTDGSGVRQVTNQLYSANPSWWPDSNRILFDASPGSDWQLPWIVNADGSNAAQLMGNPYGPYADILMGDAGRTRSSAYMTVVNYTWVSGRYAISDLRVILADWTTGQFPVAVGGVLNASPTFGSTDRTPPVSRLLDFTPRLESPYLAVRVMVMDSGPLDWGRIEFQSRPVGETQWSNSRYAEAQMGAQTAAFREVEFADLSIGSGPAVYEMRVRSFDGAGNAEPWPPDNRPSAVWDFHRFTLSGRVTDAEGIPVEGAVVSLVDSVEGSVTTGTDGRYQIRSRVWPFNNPVRIGAPGAAAVIVPYPLPVVLNATLDFTVPTGPDLLLNGTFEGAFPWPAWPSFGSLPISALPPQAVPAVGLPPTTNWLTLGWVGRAQSIDGLTPTGYEPRRWQVEYSAQGMTLFGQSPGGAVARVCLTQQSCQAPVTLSTLPFSRAVLGADGAWYVLVGLRPSDGYTLVRWLPGNAPVVLTERLNWQGGGVYEELLFDSGGRLHWLWTEPAGGLHHAVRDSGGTWSSANLLIDGVTSADALIEPGDRLQVVVCRPGGVTNYTWSVNDGWAGPVTVQSASCEGNSTAGLMRLSDGRLFASWASSGQQQLGLRAVNQEAWQTQALANFQGTCTAGIGTSTAGELTCFSQTTVTNLLITPLTPGTGAGASRVVEGVMQPTSSPNSARVLGYGAAAQEVVVDTGLDVRRVILAPSTSGQGGVAQVIDLAGVPGRSVLSFAYTLPTTRTVPGDSMALHLQTTGSPSVTVVALPPSEFMQTQRIDLSPWAGSALRLSFVVTDTANSSTIFGQVGDVHIHEQRTPAISSTTLNSDVIAIVGQNFQPSAMVTIADLPTASATRVDSRNIQAPVPAGLAPGRHVVRVTNPDGTRASGLVLYRVNQLVYLPTIRNWANPNR
jgi:hypothetical protein